MCLVTEFHEVSDLHYPDFSDYIQSNSILQMRKLRSRSFK